MMRVFRPDFPQNPQRGKFQAPNPKFQTIRSPSGKVNCRRKEALKRIRGITWTFQGITSTPYGMT
jgi:hypothetical protein